MVLPDHPKTWTGRPVVRTLIGVGLLSAGVNILYLTGSLFMLEVYDRVIPSRSAATLVGLCVIAALLYAFLGLFDVLRGRVLIRIATTMDETLSGRLFDLTRKLPLRGASSAEASLPLRDLEQVRGFVAGGGPATFFDLPWIPVYIAICWVFHPLIGLAALIGGLLLFALALVTEVLTSRALQQGTRHGSARAAQTEAVRRNAEVVQALGMGAALRARWQEATGQYRSSQQQASDVAATLGGVSKVLRMALQSAVLATGAWLVIQQQSTPGIIIAGSILAARALAPVELAIAHWKGFVAARQSWARLRAILSRIPEEDEKTRLPAPTVSLTVQALSATPPGVKRYVVENASFSLKAGQALGVIGPSGSGKSSLSRLLVGVWNPASGRVCLDGASLDQWSPDDLGQHTGYLPQDVELFAGTVAENIARFEPGAPSERVIAAARAAGVHDLVLTMAQGYDTPIGEGGAVLSAGQRQRIALARALYGDPFLVVLDEPNSNLDAEGEAALTSAILGVRVRGGIVVVVAHRPSALAGVDMVLAMADGRVGAFGPKDEVLSRVLRPVDTAAQAPRRAAAQGGSGYASGLRPVVIEGQAQ